MASQPDPGTAAEGQPGDRLAAPGRSRVPFTALTPESLQKLDPAGRLAFRVAAETIARDENPGISTTAALLLTIQRLIAEPAPEVIQVTPKEGPADPRIPPGLI